MSNSDFLLPEFFIGTIQADDGSEHPVEMVRIHMPGDLRSKPERVVTDNLRRRFADAYARFKAGQQMSADGTPLEQWNVLQHSPGVVKVLRNLDIYTIEALAQVPDTAMQGIMGGYRYRDLARAWVEEKSKSDPVREVKAENDALKAQIEAMQAQLAALMARAEVGESRPVSKKG